MCSPISNLIRKARDARRRALEALGQQPVALEILRALAGEAATNGNTALIQHYGLEIDRHTNDALSARERLEWYEAEGRSHGVHKVLRYFPELAITKPAHLEPQPAIRLEVLGAMRLRRETSTVALRGAKRKELLAMLLEARLRGRDEVSSSDLCDALYPADALGLGALKATVFKIRQSLGAELIVTTASGYALGAVASDAEEFLKTSDLQLWRGPYCEEIGRAHV